MLSLESFYADLMPELDSALEALSLSLEQSQKQQLLYYLQQLLFWNKAYNLTAIKDPLVALTKHIFDSVAIVPHLPMGSLLDVGTGAGLPAVIVAICQPQRTVTALDSNSKKIRFIKQMVGELQLKNLTPLSERIESHDNQYDIITSRAFASLTDFVMVSNSRLADNGEIWAMKGIVPQDEIAILANQWQITTMPLQVPKLDEARHLIRVVPIGTKN